MRGILGLVIITVFISGTVHAQSIKGKLLDLVDNKPLAGATLKLVSLKDSTARFSDISDKTGQFEFKGLWADSFLLKVSDISHQEFKQIIRVKDTTVDLGTLFIPKSVKSENEVTVVAKTPPTQQKGDTIQYNASQFKVNPDATSEDLIKKVPGVTVDKQGNVTAQGEQVRKVTIDGRDFFGDDATAALRNMPAEIVDKIQVFDRLSDQAQFTGFDDGNTTKAVNIVTKANMRNGQFGRMYGGYGTDDRYSAGGNVSFFKNNRRISIVGLANNINQQNFSSQDLLGVTSSGNRGGFGGGGGNFGGGGGGRGGSGSSGGQGGNRGGGGGGNFGGGQQNFLVGQQSGISTTNAIGINYSDQWGKKLTVSGSYFFNYAKNDNDQVLVRQYPTQLYNENSLNGSKNYNNRINLRLEYKMDSSNSIMLIPSLNFQNNNSISNTFGKYFGYDSVPGNQSLSNFNAKTDGYNLFNTLLFRHSFAKRGRTFSIGFNTTANRKTGNSYLTANNIYVDTSGVFKDSTQQFTDNLNNSVTLSTNIAYTEPIGKKGQLQINYNPSFTTSKADQETFQYDYVGGKYSLFDTTLSNKFNNTYNTQNGGISYRVGDRDKQFAIGINYQYSALHSNQEFPSVGKVDKTFSDLLPNLQWRKKISSKSSINVFVRTSVNPPSINQLQNVVNTTNQLIWSAGNPDLKQQYSTNLTARYTFTNTQKGQSLFVNLFVQKANDYIANATYTASKDSVIAPGLVLQKNGQLTKPVNLDGYWSLRSFVTYAVPVKPIKSNVNFNGGVSYSSLPGLVNGKNSLSDNYNYSGGVVVASNVSEYVDFNLSYNANYNIVKNATQPQLNNEYFSHLVGIQFNLLSKKGWYFQNDLNDQYYNYKNAPNQNFWLWNISAGKKFLKDQKGDLKLSVFDLLKQNKSITRNVTGDYIEDVQSKVLTQYFMLTFTYKLKNFGKAKPNNNQFNRDFRRDF